MLTIALSLAIAIGFVFAAATLFARLSTSQVSTSAQTRDTATQVALCVGLHRPLFGIGYSAQAIRENNVGDCNSRGNDIRAHNIYAQVFAEQGIFTLIAYLAVGFTMLWEAVRRRRTDDPGSRAMRTALAFSILAWLIFMGVYATANDFNVMPVWLLLGGYSLTLLDTSHKIVEPLGGLAPLDVAPPRRRELAPV
jgi:O-antigen ligase